MKFLSGAIIILTIFYSCEEPKKEIEIPVPETEIIEVVDENPMTDSIIEHYNEIGLEELTDDRILVDLRYASENNFMHTVLYDTINKLFVQKEVKERLTRCQDFLDSIQPGFHLKIFDGVRPLLVQREMWEAMDSVPARLRGRFVSNPIFGSGHNYGTSVDLTICDSLGKELDMGAGYDDFRNIAFPAKEAHFLKTGELTKAQYENRKLLRRVMRFQKFYGIPSEWWHFNAYSRSTAESKYEILLNESGGHKHWVSPKVPKDTIVDSLILIQ